MRKVFAALLALVLACSLIGTLGLPVLAADPPEKTALVFADVGWDSIRFHNAVAGLIAEGTTEISATQFIRRGYENIDVKLRQLGARVEWITRETKY